MSNFVVTHLGYCITSVLQYVERSVDFLLNTLSDYMMTGGLFFINIKKVLTLNTLNIKISQSLH